MEEMMFLVMFIIIVILIVVILVMLRKITKLEMRNAVLEDKKDDVERQLRLMTMMKEIDKR